ncbi:MAG: hypothetical protein WCO82_03005 [Sphingomonadales bacterium]|jgi:hypothetical protein
MAFLDPPDAAAKRRQYRIAAGATFATVVIAVLFAIESEFGYLPPDPKLIYFQSWGADRSTADMIADKKATEAARAARLAKAKAYIATLQGKAKEDAQKELDAYLAGGMLKKEIPYVAAEASVEPLVKVEAAAEPPVE